MKTSEQVAEETKWLFEVKSLLRQKERADDIDEDAWLDYQKQGLSPSESINEDDSYS